MKTKCLLMLAVLLALAVLSAPVLANPAAIAYGAQVPIIQEELKELQPNATLKGDFSAYMPDGAPIGFRAADNLRVTAFHGIALHLSADYTNLPGEETHRVYFGFPGSITAEDFAAWSERKDIKHKLKEARKQNPGCWILAKPAGANRWEAWVSSDILAVNETTDVIVKLEGKFNKKTYKILWLISITCRKMGTYEERLQISCVEAPANLAGMPREQVFASLEGFHPAWAAPVMSQPPLAMIPGAANPASPAQTSFVPPTPKEKGGLNIVWDSGLPPPEKQGEWEVVPPPARPEQEGVSAAGPGTPAPTELLAIRPDGGYQVLDRENDDRWAISRSQKVYVYFNRPLQEGERFEYGMTYLDSHGQEQWTHDAEGNPFAVPPSEVVEDHFYLTFTNRANVAPGPHAIFVRVVGHGDELAEIVKTIIVKEDAR